MGSSTVTNFIIDRFVLFTLDVSLVAIELRASCTLYVAATATATAAAAAAASVAAAATAAAAATSSTAREAQEANLSVCQLMVIYL